MKKRSMSLFSVAFAVCFLVSKSANAFFPLPTIDFSAIVQGIKTSIEQVKSSSTIVTTTQTISEISSTIGDEVATVTKFIDEGKSKLKEAENIKKQAESYKKEYENYKKYAEEKINMAKEAKENAERLKELLQNKDALLDTVKGKVTSSVKSYAGDMGLPSSMEDINAIKDNVGSKIEQGKSLVGEVGLKSAEVLNNQNKKVEKNESVPESNEKVLLQELNERDAEIRGAAQKAQEAPALGGRIGEKADLLAKEAINSAEKKLKTDSLKVENKFRDKNGAVKEEKSLVSVAKSEKEDVKSSFQKVDKGELKSSVKAEKMPAASLDKSSAINKKNELKAPTEVGKAPVKAEKSPAKTFRQGVKLKTSSIKTEKFFSKKKYDMSFAFGDVSDGETAKTGKSTSMDAIVPRDVAEFCELSVADLKDDTEKIIDCIQKITKPHDGSKTSQDEMEASTRQILKMRKQNTAESLAIAMKMENIGANQEDVLKDLDEKAENLSQGRQISSMAPHYSMEIAKAFKNYAFVRATQITFEVFDDMEQLRFD